MTDKIDIKSGVPVPKGNMLWPHREMEVGEYFEVDGSKVSRTAVYVANHRWGKRLGRKFVARTENGFIRVWRTA